MLWCSWCCEGVHPYCLEEGEGPETGQEEATWVCRRCAVCHVCGSGVVTPAADDQLHRCSACLNYYHLECLGPGAHETCNPPNDALWVSTDDTISWYSLHHYLVSMTSYPGIHYSIIWYPLYHYLVSIIPLSGIHYSIIWYP